MEDMTRRTYIEKMLTGALILLLGMSATFFSWFYARDVVKRYSERDLARDAAQIQTIVDRRVNRYVGALYGARALFEASTEVTRADWTAFVRGRKAHDFFPGTAGFYFIQRVPYEQTAAFVSEVRREGFAGFSVYPALAGADPYVVSYIEPHASFDTIHGFDYGADPIRRAALERARDQNAPIIISSDRSVLALEPAFAVVLPVYRNGGTHDTLHSRREQLTGFVAAAFTVEDFFKSFEDSFPPEVRLRVYDGTVSDRTKFYDSLPNLLTGANDAEGKRYELPVSAGGRTWQLVVTAPSGYGLHAPAKLLPYAVVAFGAAATLCLLWLVLALETGGRRAYLYTVTISLYAVCCALLLFNLRSVEQAASRDAALEVERIARFFAREVRDHARNAAPVGATSTLRVFLALNRILDEAVFTVIGDDGMLVARAPEGSEYLDQILPAEPLVRAALNRTGTGVVVDLDGVPRMTAFSDLHPERAAVIAVGMEPARVLPAIRTAIRQSTLLLFAVATLGLAAVILLTELLLVRKLRAWTSR